MKCEEVASLDQVGIFIIKTLYGGYSIEREQCVYDPSQKAEGFNLLLLTGSAAPASSLKNPNSSSSASKFFYGPGTWLNVLLFLF